MLSLTFFLIYQFVYSNSDWKRSVKISNYNCGFVSSSPQFFQVYLYVVWNPVIRYIGRGLWLLNNWLFSILECTFLIFCMFTMATLKTLFPNASTCHLWDHFFCLFFSWLHVICSCIFTHLVIFDSLQSIVDALFLKI